MNTMVVSATELKNNLAEIINTVWYEKKTTIVERHGKPLLKLVPFDNPKRSVKDMEAFHDRYFGSMPNFPDVTNMRYFRKRRITL